MFFMISCIIKEAKIMYKYIIRHEEYIRSIKEAEGFNPKDTAEYHYKQISFLQHERLAHLLVTLFFGIMLFVSYALTCFCPSALLFVLNVILTVLELFYIHHYYRLENAVQRWYEIYKNILTNDKG